MRAFILQEICFLARLSFLRAILFLRIERVRYMREHFSQAKLSQIQKEIKELSVKISNKQDEIRRYRTDYRLLEQDYVLKEKDLLRKIPSNDTQVRKKYIDEFYEKKNTDLRNAVDKINKADDEYQHLQQQMSYLQKAEFEEGAKLVPTYEEYAHPERTSPFATQPTWTRANQVMTKSFTTDFRTLEKTAEELHATIKADKNQIEYRLANHQTAKLDLNTNTIYLNDLSDGSLRDSALLFKASGINSIDISNMQGQTKANMWLASRLANLEVTGYTPNADDDAKLAAQQQHAPGITPPHP